LTEILKKVPEKILTNFIVNILSSIYASTENILILEILLYFTRDLDSEVRISCIIGIGLVSANKDSNEWGSCSCEFENNFSEKKSKYSTFELLKIFLSSPDEYLKSTAFLVIGIVHAGSSSFEILDSLQQGLMDSDSVTVQSACISMGLIMNQSGDMTLCRHQNKTDKNSSDIDHISYVRKIIELQKIYNELKENPDKNIIPIDIENITEDEINNEIKNMENTRRSFNHSAFSEFTTLLNNIFLQSTHFQSSYKFGTAVSKGLMEVAGRGGIISLFKNGRVCLNSMSAFMLVSDPYWDYEKYLYSIFMVKVTKIVLLDGNNTDNSNNSTNSVNSNSNISLNLGKNFLFELPNIEIDCKFPNIFFKTETSIKKRRKRKIDSLELNEFENGIPTFILNNSRMGQNDANTCLYGKYEKVKSEYKRKNGVIVSLKELNCMGIEKEDIIFL